MPLSYMLLPMGAANVLLLAEAQGLVVEFADVIVEVEEAMNKEGPLDGKHRHQHVQGHRRQAVPDVLFQFQMQKCIICSIYMYKSDDRHNHHHHLEQSSMLGCLNLPFEKGHEEAKSYEDHHMNILKH